MQLGLILLLIEVALIVHAAKTGRFWPWGYVILFLPMLLILVLRPQGLFGKVVA